MHEHACKQGGGAEFESRERNELDRRDLAFGGQQQSLRLVVCGDTEVHHGGVTSFGRVREAVQFELRARVAGAEPAADSDLLKQWKFFPEPLPLSSDG